MDRWDCEFCNARIIALADAEAKVTSLESELREAREALEKSEALGVNRLNSIAVRESALSAERTARERMREALEGLVTAINDKGVYLDFDSSLHAQALNEAIDDARAALAAEPGDAGASVVEECDCDPRGASKSMLCRMGEPPCNCVCHLPPEGHPVAAEVKNEG